MISTASVEDQPAAPPSGAALRVCLAASGGGHVRQLLDLEAAWSKHDAFFISEDTALSRSLARRWSMEFVPHVALGQGRLGAPVHMVLSAVRNFAASARIIFRRRPDVIISTGAGSVFFSLLWAKILGAKVVVIESFARFEGLSAFARIAGPLADVRVVQSRALSRYWPDAEVFDPLRVLDCPRPPKEPLVFATVGATLPFDRLIASVADLARDGRIAEQVVMQTGVGGLEPEGFETHPTLPLDQMLGYLRKADIVVCHGGTGSLITALREGCRIVAIPRRFDRGEHYDDHQAEITSAFAARGLIAVANSSDELASALEIVRARDPVAATSDASALAARLDQRLQGWATVTTAKRRRRG
jgi:UDP-N-acetylglucosamine transferase subunit ALG13